jgi:predicted nucleic acid-binding protein
MSARIALDASAALGWLIESQLTPAGVAFADQTAGDVFIAPLCFRWETRHALFKFERRALLDASEILPDLADLESRIEFEFEPDPAAQSARLAAIEALSRAERMSFFDASYLELALRTQAVLATRDSVLIDIARRRGVVAHDLR